MSQKLPVDGFEWVKNSKFNEDFIKEYDKNSDKGYFLEVDVEYPKNLCSSHKDLPFLTEREENLKSRKTYLFNRTQIKICCSYKGLKTSNKFCLKLKKVHRVIQFKQEAWLKPYIDMDTDKWKI